MRYARPNQPVVFTLTSAPAGLAATLTFRLIDLAGAHHVPPSNDGIAWVDGVYTVTRAVGFEGTYQPRWDHSSLPAPLYDEEQLVINATGEPPVVHGPIVPTPEQLRAASNIGFAEYGYPEPGVGQTDRLELPIREAVPELSGYLRTDVEAIPVDAKHAPMVRRALRMLVEYNVAGSVQDILDTAADFDLVQSFSAGPVSESRRNQGGGRNILHPWPALNKLLNVLRWAVDGNLADSDYPDIGYRPLRDPNNRVGREGMEPYPGGAASPFAPWLPGTTKL